MTKQTVVAEPPWLNYGLSSGPFRLLLDASVFPITRPLLSHQAAGRESTDHR